MDWLINAGSTGHKFVLMFVAIMLFVVVMGAILLAVDRPKRVPGWVVAAAFLGPTVIGLGFGLVYPGLRTVWGSLLDSKGKDYVGLENYVRVFSEDQFQTVLRNTLMWVILVPLLATLIGLVYAVLVDRTRFEYLAKTLIFLPMAISMVGAGIIWKFVYEFRPDQPGVNQIGILNQLLVWLGLPPQQFLLSEPANTLFLIAVMIWIQTGFAMTVLSAAIKAIPDDIVEAARLDGLHGTKMFRFITVPSIRPALVVVVTTIAMGTLKVFDIVRTMTGGNFGTSVVANEFYVQSFRIRDLGLGAALAVILFVLVIPLVIYNVRQLRIAEEIR
ncbi:carbohydrate ABC transporter permease [Cellulomonas chengniuliangii]|uniref:Sugar ABC transporter permease n=1 Tax=Cellulomonas chengniuliangii TaxID=2968084 RepID=A0ABY5L0Q4_9CELL|nr:sugar ABC transporter permease [Cellulomonas chengniuliangii]MCC2307745.1 sugar ABC transporter permease [Cellulomonas chengniuliangii]MCC2318856.1 sugar ABC transporter permease [Cellulomonas chengniuliangii]UUI75498.1 sugar ABC transporter permease [Cellulomonas chengniuliangii]